jgi:hypothetical protein
MKIKDLSTTTLNLTNNPKDWIGDWYANRENIWKSN